jgi:hypothetical protein
MAFDLRFDSRSGSECDFVSTSLQSLRDGDECRDEMGVDGQTCQENTHTPQKNSA